MKPDTELDPPYSDARGHRAEEVLAALLESGMPSAGIGSLGAVVERLGRALSSDLLLVGELRPDAPGRLRLLAAFPREVLEGTVELEVAPASDAGATAAGVRVSPDSLARLVPGLDPAMGGRVEGNFGVPMSSASGEPLGLVVNLSRSPVDDPSFLTSVLEMLAGRATAEIERARAEQALRESERRYRAIVDSIPMGMHMYRLEGDGRLVFTGANPAADRILGVDNRRFVGQTIEEAFPSLADTDVPAAYREAAAEGVAWRSDQVVYQGGDIAGAFLVQAFQTTPGNMVASFLDITERRRDESELLRREAHLGRLNRITRAALGAPDLSSLLRLLAEQLVDLVEADGGLVALWDEESESVASTSAAGCLLGAEPSSPAGLAEAVRFLLERGSPACAECVLSGPGMSLPTVLGGGAQAAMGLPLAAGDQRLGAAFLVHVHPHRFTPEEVALCEQVASQVALAVAKARLDLWNRRRVATLLALHETGVDLSGSLELDPLLRAIVDRTRRLLEASIVGLYLVQPDGSLLLAIGEGPLAAHIGRRVELGVGASGEAAASGKPKLVEHYARWAGRIRLYDQYDFGSVLSAPMVWHGRTLGVLFAEHRQPGRFGRREVEVAALLAAQAAAAVASARLYEDLERAYGELERAYDATLEGWVHALDLRDKETEGHTQRVSRMAVELARAMGVPEDELVHIRRGALLHDIGKIGIPDAVLLKPGPLDDREMLVMRRHAGLAHAMLSSVPHLQPALAIPYGHHERWDGSGYPQGLQGEEIPFPARLFAVIDVWDALSHDRHYRPAWPQERAQQYLRDHAGTLFDPRVVEAFLASVCPPEPERGHPEAAGERGKGSTPVGEDPSAIPSGSRSG